MHNSGRDARSEAIVCTASLKFCGHVYVLLSGKVYADALMGHPSHIGTHTQTILNRARHSGGRRVLASPSLVARDSLKSALLMSSSIRASSSAWLGARACPYCET